MKIYSVQLCLKNFADSITLFKIKRDAIQFINNLYNDGIPVERLKLKEFNFYKGELEAIEKQINLPF